MFFVFRGTSVSFQSGASLFEYSVLKKAYSLWSSQHLLVAYLFEDRMWCHAGHVLLQSPPGPLYHLDS